MDKRGVSIGEVMAIVKAIPGSAAGGAIAAQQAAEAAQAAAEQVAESIPQDYSAMSADVADLKSAINDNVETSATSAHAYPIGSYIVYDGTQYRVISPIAFGDTLTVGTNIEETTVFDELDAAFNGRTTTVIGSINHLNPNTLTANSNINSSGQITTLNGYDVTDFIELNTSASSIAFTGMNSAGTARVCLPINVLAFYDSSQTMIERNSPISSNTITAIPENAEYARFCVDHSYVTGRNVMVEFVNSISDISSTYAPYEEVTSRTKGINELIEDFEDLEDVPSDLEALSESVSDVSSQVEQNTSNIDDMLGNAQTLDKLATFSNGGINSQTGAFNNYYVWRVATQDIVTLTYSITVTIADGFRLYVARFNGDSFASAGWVESGTVLDSGSRVRLMIARTTDNESETANIETFCSKATYTCETNFQTISEGLKNIKAIIPYGLTWDWWITANSVDAFGNAYIGYIDTDGYAGVLRRQPDGVMQYKRLEKSYSDDDHDGMATTILPNGRILVIGSYGHAANNHMICYRSAKPYSIDEMEKLSFDIPQGSTYKYKLTYSQVFQYDGKIFDFCRCTITATGVESVTGYLCLVSSDSGDNWTVYQAIFAEDPYVTFAVCADDSKYLKLVHGINPASGSNTFKGAVINLDNYKIYDLNNTEIGEMTALGTGTYDQNSCAKPSDMTGLIAQTENSKKGRLFTVAKTAKANTVFLYATAVDTSSSDFTYKLYNNGTVVELGSSGTPFGNTHYISGACFGKDTGTIYYSKATTSVADGDHELHKVKVFGSSVASDDIIAEASMCILRPLFLGNGELATVVGHYNDQTQSGYNGSFTDWELKPLFTHA